MLTIHTPISLTVDSSILQINDNFTNRLIGNYQLIGSGLEMEDMVHFISQPPEVYLAEGGMTALVENQNITENQNLKLDIINNVLNRILVADTYSMTYQDQVFIENVLKKIGIDNVQQFMNHVQNIREESKNVSRLTELYWNEKEAFEQLIEYRQLQTRHLQEGQQEEQARLDENPMWLHQEIMNRLQTGAVYQELRNYLYMSSPQHFRITGDEMEISEQTVTAQNILLNKLRNYTMIEEQPLVYHHVNVYESGDENTNYLDNQQVNSQLIRATLLNALHQLYAVRIDELTTKNHLWYELADTVYQVTQNTISRLASQYYQHFVSQNEADQYSRYVQEYQRNEIAAIEKLFEIHLHQKKQATVQMVAAPEELDYRGDFEGESLDGMENQPLSQQIVNQQINENVVHGQQIQNLSQNEILLKNQLEQINQTNIQNQQLLNKIQQLSRQQEGPQRINQKKAREDALLALSNPQEVILDYLESQTQIERQEIITRRELTEILGEDTVKIYESLEQYQKSPKIYEAKQFFMDPESRLIRDIQMHQQSVTTELMQHREEKVWETKQLQEENHLFREILPEQIKTVKQESHRALREVELIHKQEETLIEEEMLEEIRGMQRNIQIQQEKNTEQIVEKNLHQEIIHQRIQEFETRQNEELVRMITDKMQKQLGNISEQVYGKLEKRMDTERRRRGL